MASAVQLPPSLTRGVWLCGADRLLQPRLAPLAASLTIFVPGLNTIEHEMSAEFSLLCWYYNIWSTQDGCQHWQGVARRVLWRCSLSSTCHLLCPACFLLVAIARMVEDLGLYPEVGRPHFVEILGVKIERRNTDTQASPAMASPRPVAVRAEPGNEKVEQGKDQQFKHTDSRGHRYNTELSHPSILFPRRAGPTDHPGMMFGSPAPACTVGRERKRASRKRGQLFLVVQ